MKKKLLVFIALVVLVVVYVFQRFDFFGALTEAIGFGSSGHPFLRFGVNRFVRMVINDSACLVLIWAWFEEKKYTSLAGLLFLIEVVFLLPLYLWIKLSLEGDSEISSPILSQVHRMIVNPMLMFLLMVAFLYQRKRESK